MLPSAGCSDKHTLHGSYLCTANTQSVFRYEYNSVSSGVLNFKKSSFILYLQGNRDDGTSVVQEVSNSS